MQDQLFDIGAEGIDVTKIVEKIKETVKEKKKNGVYSDIKIAKAEIFNISNLKDEENFLPFYLDCLKESIYVDISDFEITERRAGLGKVLIPIKKGIWKLLKFYTYRMWSQQNQINGLLHTALESMESKYKKKVEELEKRIEELEKRIEE